MTPAAPAVLTIKQRITVPRAESWDMASAMISFRDAGLEKTSAPSIRFAVLAQTMSSLRRQMRMTARSGGLAPLRG
jgi:hypothetical protein